MAKSVACRLHKVTNGATKLGARYFRLKAGNSVPVYGGKIKVCPTKHGRKTVYKAVGAGGSLVPMVKQRKGYKP